MSDLTLIQAIKDKRYVRLKSIAWRMTDQADSTPSTLQKLSQEPGFISFDLFKPAYAHKLPLRTPGLLAFLFVEEGCEMVLKLVLADDLAKEFAHNRLFCGRANRAAYYVFAEESDFELRALALAARLQFFARMTERYNVPQTARRF